MYEGVNMASKGEVYLWKGNWRGEFVNVQIWTIFFFLDPVSILPGQAETYTYKYRTRDRLTQGCNRVSGPTRTQNEGSIPIISLFISLWKHIKKSMWPVRKSTCPCKLFSAANCSYLRYMFGTQVWESNPDRLTDPGCVHRLASQTLLHHNINRDPSGMGMTWTQ